MDHNHNDINFNPVAKVKVVGVGGGGNNSIKTLTDIELEGLEFIVANTDRQVLEQFDPKQILCLGDKRGIGAGANPEIGKQAAIESAAEIKQRLDGANLVIITAGMGGGTGTGAAPEIAKIAKESGALVIAIMTTPFSFEGPKRMKVALKGIEQIKKHVDSYIIISNNKLLTQCGTVPFNEAFKYSDLVLRQTIRTLIDIIAVPGIINLDYADLETVIKNSGEGVVGIGNASGNDRAIKAITNAISSPILESSIVGASDAIVYVSAPRDISLNEISEALETMRNIVGNDINIIFGINNYHSEDKEKMGEVYISVIATGLKKDAPKEPQEIQKEITSIISENESVIENDETREFLINQNSFVHTDDFVSYENTHEENESDDLVEFLK